MEKNPKKSKALIITIIAIMILLILGYLLLFRNNEIFGIKSSSDTNGSTPASGIENFVSLLFKPKPQPTATTVVSDQTGTTPASTGTTGTLDTTGDTGNGTGLNTDTGISGDNGSSDGEISAGTGTGYNPALEPLPTPGPADTVGPTDTGISGTTSALAQSTTAPSTPVVSQNECPDDPLVFTASEQAELTDLLNQYYALSPELKTDDDLALLQNNITTDQTLIDQANQLTQECTSQKADPAYTGPQAVEGNPYYQNPNGGDATSYLPGVSSDWINANSNPANVPNPLTNYGDFEKAFGIW